MALPRLTSEADLTVALDYGQFFLHTSEQSADDGDRAIALAEVALNGDGIAQDATTLVVLSPYQNNFAMPLRIEVWDSEPSSALTDWQEAFSAHLEIGPDGLTFESPTLEPQRLPIAAGSYGVLITGRGFVAEGWPGSTEPSDSWRLRFWPATDHTAPVRLAKYEPPCIRHPEPEFREAGIAAARRIYDVLDTYPHPDVPRAAARAERVLPGTRRKLFRWFHKPQGWVTHYFGGGGIDGFRIFGDYSRAHPDTAPHRAIVPLHCDVECTFVDAKSPAYSIVTWTWWRRPPERTLAHTRDGRPAAHLVTEPTPTLRFDLVNVEARDGYPMTKVTVTHDHIPAELADDLSAYWAWALERVDYDYDLGGQRRKGFSA